MTYAWRQRVNKAINEDLIDIWLQPIVHISSVEVKGYEALARFPSEDGIYWSPDIWFKEAYQAGLNIDLELSAIRTAISKIPYLHTPEYLSINISAPTIIEEPAIIGLLSGFPNRIVIEITEHDAIEHYSPLVKRLEEIRQVRGKSGIRVSGVLVAVDDAGSGYASLRHIIRLKPDIIKIDAYLVRELHKEENFPKKAAVKALTGLSRDLKIEVVAEGVESKEEALCLKSLQVPLGQGYYFGMPKPVGKEGV